MKRLGIFVVAIICTCMAFISCEKEEQTKTEDFSTHAIAGNYVGTLSALGYADEPQRAYVTLTRRSSDVVSFEISCENFDINPDPVNLIVSEKIFIIKTVKNYPFIKAGESFEKISFPQKDGNFRGLRQHRRRRPYR